MKLQKEILTKSNDDQITLSINTNGLKATTLIKVNNKLLTTLEDGFSNFNIGTNTTLKNSKVIVETAVFKTPFSSQSRIGYLIEGASEEITESSSSPFVGTTVNNYSMEITFD